MIRTSRPDNRPRRVPPHLGLVSLLAVTAVLSGCDGDHETAVVTVTETVTVPAHPTQQVPAPLDPEYCKQIELQRNANERLHRDGYADDYTDLYDQMLDTYNCP